VNASMTAAQQQPAGSSQAQAGFTLLEVLVALSILGIALTVILQVFSADLRNIKAAADYDEAAAKAAARMRSIVEYETPSEPKTWVETSQGGYTMAVAVDNYIPERTENLPVKMMQIELTIQWPGISKGRSGSKSLTIRTIKIVGRS